MSEVSNLNNRIIELEKQVKDLTLTNKDLEFQLSCLIDENELELKSPSPKSINDEIFDRDSPSVLLTQNSTSSDMENEIKPKIKKEKKEKKIKKLEVEINYSIVEKFLKEFFQNNDFPKNLTSDVLYSQFEKYSLFNPLITKHKFRIECKPFLLRKGRYIIGFTESNKEIN